MKALWFATALTAATLLDPMAAQTPGEPRFRPPGKMVDVGGYRVHLNCYGEGNPTVMIVGAGYSFDWSLVQTEAAKFTRVCTYDPSGSVWSDAGPAPSCQGRVEEIHTMLHNAGVTGPLILVGHSVGAAFARLYAARYPGDVKGMVIEDHVRSYRMTFAPGMLRSDEEQITKLPPWARDMHRWAAARAGMSNDGRAFLDRCAAEGATTASTSPDALRDKPLVVIANQYLAGSEDYRTVQAGLLALTKDSKAMIAGDSGHGVLMENPGVFIQAIREVTVAVRTKSGLRL